MSKNQEHGIIFENHIRQGFIYAKQRTVEQPCGNKNQINFDIGKEYDNINYLPTSVKTTKSNTICLSSAPAFWSINEPYRLLVGHYRQVGALKRFYKISEYTIPKADHSKIIGDITLEEVIQFDLELKSFKKGQHVAAREFAKARKENRFISRSIVELNHKIDSKTQRRLQCSINKLELDKIINNKNIYNSNDSYRGIKVEYEILSSAREF